MAGKLFEIGPKTSVYLRCNSEFFRGIMVRVFLPSDLKFVFYVRLFESCFSDRSTGWLATIEGCLEFLQCVEPLEEKGCPFDTFIVKFFDIELQNS